MAASYTASHATTTPADAADAANPAAHAAAVTERVPGSTAAIPKPELSKPRAAIPEQYPATTSASFRAPTGAASS